MTAEETLNHKKLDNGMEVVCATLPHRRAVAIEFRVRAGVVDEPADRLGLARIVEETLARGTEKFDARGISDAFDEIGASHSGSTERESLRFSTLALPEYVDRSIELHADFLRNPTFPNEYVEVAVELARQDRSSLEDDPHTLCDKLVGQQAYGELLGRHYTGEFETLEKITRDDVTAFWRKYGHAGRFQVAAAGPIEMDQLCSSLSKYFDGFGSPDSPDAAPVPITFDPVQKHYDKDTEQVQVFFGFQGVPKSHELYATQRVILAILSGGMSSRLFTEVREKQGLVYWISAWPEHPRGMGMIFVGGSSRVEHCERTYTTVLRELDRLTEDITQEELDKAKTQIEVSAIIRGDRTRARCMELSDDLFQFGKPVPVKEKLDAVRAVTLEDIRAYQQQIPWKPITVATLGPKEIAFEG